ncbi:hypothetical protein ASC66_15500 [Leifsonia sp. Root4]|nr:hypothetical protein ASC66_15500 [Leifsonia sp. Root4]
MEHQTEIRDFLTSRRCRITSEQAGLPAYGANRRAKGLRREEVAMLCNYRHDMLAAQEMARALYTPLFAARPDAVPHNVPQNVSQNKE